MKLSELIEQAQKLMHFHGNLEVVMKRGHAGLYVDAAKIIQVNRNARGEPVARIEPVDDEV